MEALELLTKAGSPKIVQDIFVLCFKNRKKPISDTEKSGVAKQLGVTEDQALDLLTTVREVISESLYNSMTSDDLGKFLGSVSSQVKDIVVKIITHYLQQWREASLQSQVSLPRLRNIDWRIDIKSASNEMSRMSVPTVIVQLGVEQLPEKVGEKTKVRSIDFELSSEALAVMLESLDQIKSQLETVTDGFNRMVMTCFSKCVSRYTEGELSVGEGVCTDRCVYKYLEVSTKVAQRLYKPQG